LIVPHQFSAHNLRKNIYIYQAMIGTITDSIETNREHSNVIF